MAGGLLALFTVVLRVTITVLLKLFKTLRRCGSIVKFIQVATVILLLLSEGITTATLVVYQLSDVEFLPFTEEIAGYLISDLPQFLVIMGTSTLLLLIPWSKYALPDTKEKRSKYSEKYKIDEMPDFMPTD